MKGEQPLQAPPRLTMHLVKIEQAVRDISLGQIGMPEFEALVQGFEDLFSQKLQEVRDMEIPSDFQAEVSPEIEIGTRGIEWYLAAMADFRAYVEGRDLAFLKSGMEKARQGNDLVNEALQLNWATYQTYRQAAEEYLAQQGLT